MTTQDHITIKDIKDDVAILKDGSAIVVMQTSAVNFDLLSENEQLAIISTFAALLNSLSFPIQIIIRSKRLDISSYINSLTAAAEKQNNPLMKEMMKRYKNFVETIIRENEVLDKQFYVVVSVASVEAGLTGSIEKNFDKAMTILMPRRDHIMRQIARIGLKATQLNSERLVKLFYDIYNESDVIALEDAQAVAVGQSQSFDSAQDHGESKSQETGVQSPVITPTSAPQPAPPPPVVQPPIATQPSPAPQPVSPPVPTPNIPPPNYATPKANYSNPFVVEELPEDYGRA